MSILYKNNVSSWDPENREFWEKTGRRIALRNLSISIPALLLGFVVWFLWPTILLTVIVKSDTLASRFTTTQLFTIAAMPGLSGATLRIFYSFMPEIFGGRNWTVFSTGILLIPVIWIGFAVQDLSMSFTTMLLISALCGLGGGVFSSSMATISFFFPRHEEGAALGLNAGLGNFGVSVVQFTVPLIIAFSIFGGDPQIFSIKGEMQKFWLHNAALIWVIPLIIVTIAAWLGMDNLPTARASLIEQAVIFKRKHMYLTTILYIMSFGSYIGYSAAFPLLMATQFPHIDSLQYAFLGPMVGALIRPIGGWLCDKLNSGAIVAFWDVIVMILAVIGVLYFLDTKNFVGFFVMFLILFTATGIANGAIFRMIGVLFPPKEKAPILGFSAAIAAYGAFVLPESFAASINYFGTPDIAFYSFLAFYSVCLFITWWWYVRKKAEAKC